MTDITYSKTMTVRRNSPTVVSGGGSAYKPVKLVATTELVASASATTIKVGRIPSNARIDFHGSRLYYDDLATSGSPTIDIGLASVNNNITSDDDALNDGINVYTAASNAPIIKDFANAGKQAWEFVNGQTTDPTGELDVYLTVRDAATTATGTVTAEINYVID